MKTVKKHSAVLFIISALVLSPAEGHTRSAEGTSGQEGRTSVTAAQVIQDYIRASGGPALSGVKTEQRKGTLLRGISGQVPFQVFTVGFPINLIDAVSGVSIQFRVTLRQTRFIKKMSQ